MDFNEMNGMKFKKVQDKLEKYGIEYGLTENDLLVVEGEVFDNEDDLNGYVQYILKNRGK